MDLGVPAIDLCLHMIGYPKVTRVSAVTFRGDYEVEDAAVVMMATDEGSAITVEVSWSFFGSEDRQFFRVMGTEGSGSLPPLQVFKQLGGRPLDVTPRQPVPRAPENPYHATYRRELDMLRARDGGGARGTTPRGAAPPDGGDRGRLSLRRMGTGGRALRSMSTILSGTGGSRG